MILTSDYSPVLASFDTPMGFQENKLNYVSDKKDSGNLFYHFDVGPLEYRLDMNGRQGTWDVSFFLNDIKGSREELAKYFSKVLRRTVTPSEVPGWKKYFLGRSNKNLNLRNAPEVFSTVIGIINKVSSIYTVKCLVFRSEDEKKSRIYNRIIETHFKGWRTVVNDGYDYKICKV